MEIIAGILVGFVLYAGFEAVSGVLSSSSSIGSQAYADKMQRQKEAAMRDIESRKAS